MLDDPYEIAGTCLVGCLVAVALVTVGTLLTGLVVSLGYNTIARGWFDLPWPALSYWQCAGLGFVISFLTGALRGRVVVNRS